MEKICVFCGRSLGRWEKKSLVLRQWDPDRM